MYLELKNPYQILKKADYIMVGRQSNQFRRHTSDKVWFHVFVEHDNQGIKIHQDYSNAPVGIIYKQHKTQQKNDFIIWEAKRIKGCECKWWEFWNK